MDPAVPQPPLPFIPQKSKKFYQSTLFIVVLVILILTFITGIFFFYGKNLIGQTSVSKEASSSARISVKPKRLNDFLPIDPDHPSIQSAAVLFTLTTEITDLAPATINGNKFTRLSTRQEGLKIPSVFYINPKTKFKINDAGKLKEASSSALQKGQNINITVQKGLKKNYYQTLSVVILLNQDKKTASPSASPQ